jgi:multidrug resistance efflux pump
LLLLSIAVFGHWELKIPADFVVVAREDQIVRLQTEGIVVEIPVRQNTEVRKGQILVRTSDIKMQQKMTELADQIAQRRTELRLLQSPPRPEDIDRIERNIETRRVEWENARPNREQRAQLEQSLEGRRSALSGAEKDFDRVRQMYELQLISLSELQKVEAIVQVRRSEVGETEAAIRALSEVDGRETERKAKLLAEAESERRQIMAGPKPEQIQQKQAEIAGLESQRALLDREMEKTEIRSPIDGVVTTPYLEKKLYQHLDAGEEFCRVMDIRRVTIEMSVPEKEMADVKQGNPVRMKFFSLPEEEIEGHVDSISLAAEVVNDRRIILVRSELENIQRDGRFLLRPETSGSAKILCGQRRIIDLATRSLRNWIRIEFWSYF